MTCENNCPVFTPIPLTEKSLGNPYYCDYSDYITSIPYTYEVITTVKSKAAINAAFYRSLPTLTVIPKAKSSARITSGFLRLLLRRFGGPAETVASQSKITGGILKTLLHRIIPEPEKAYSSSKITGGTIRNLKINLGPYILPLASSSKVNTGSLATIANPNIISHFQISQTPQVSIFSDEQALIVWNTSGAIASTDIKTYQGKNTAYSSGTNNHVVNNAYYVRNILATQIFTLTLIFIPLGTNSFVILDTTPGNALNGLRVYRAENENKIRVAAYSPSQELIFLGVSLDNSLITGELNTLKVVRSETQIKMQLNGVIFHTADISPSAFIGGSGYLTLFNSVTHNAGFHGYLAEFKLVKAYAETLTGG